MTSRSRARVSQDLRTQGGPSQISVMFFCSGGLDDVVDALVEPRDAAVGVVGAEHQEDGRPGRRLRDLLERLRAADVHADLGEALEVADLRHAHPEAVAQHIGGRCADPAKAANSPAPAAPRRSPLVRWPEISPWPIFLKRTGLKNKEPIVALRWRQQAFSRPQAMAESPSAGRRGVIMPGGRHLPEDTSRFTAASRGVDRAGESAYIHAIPARFRSTERADLPGTAPPGGSRCVGG